MKTTLLTGCLLLAAFHPAVADDANLIGFWDFKDGIVGETALTVSDKGGRWTGTAAKANAAGDKGNLPTFSAACPSSVIYADASQSEIISIKPQSLHFSIAGDTMGGLVDIAGLSTELTAHSAFTVEFFVRLDDTNNNPWTEPLAFRTADRYASVTVGCGSGTGVKLNNCNLASPGSGSFATGTVRQNALNLWLHLACVYEQTDAESSSGTLKLYLNRTLAGTLAYTNTPLGAVQQPLRIGASLGTGRVAHVSYCFRGDICAIRVKSVALESSGFMVTGEGSEMYAVPEGDSVGFWDFKDGLVGASATSVTNKGFLSFLGAGVGSALTDLSNVDKGVLPVFSDDVPGRYVYSSHAYSTLLAENPQSLQFTTENASQNTQSAPYQSVGGGMVSLPDIGSAISAQKSYTIECFFKDEDWSAWQWAAGIFGFYSNRENGGKSEVQAMISPVRPSDTSWNLKAAGATCNRTTTWKDGAWHHLALVYDGASSNASLYVDYALGQTVSFTNFYRAGEAFVLGTRADLRATYAFRGKVACLRIMPKALAQEEFMVAVDARMPDGTVFSWNFEEGADKTGLVVTNAAGLPSANEKSANNTQVYCIHKETLPKYSGDVAKGRVAWGEDALWTNSACIWFQGCSSLAGGTANRVYAGTEMNFPASPAPYRNPESWTMEAMVKVQYEPTFINESATGALLFGKYGNSAVHANPTTYPAYCWMLTRLPSGKLKICWTIDDGEAYTANSPNRGSATTADAYLSDKAWHHVALTYDKPTRTFSLYVDYQSVLTAPIGETDLYDGPYGYYFSRMQPSSGFEGWMDEIRFTGKVLSPSRFVRLDPISGLTIIFR